MSLQVYSKKTELRFDEVVGLHRSAQTQDWYGRTNGMPLSWTVAVDPTALWFCCSLPAGRHRSSPHARGAFVEGLWEEDVAELFIKDPSGRYQELNFHPSGAWWSMTHSSYRVRDLESMPPILNSIHTEVAQDVWRVVASFDRRSFQIPLLAESLLHISGIVRGKDEVVFLSSHPATHTAPDFHRDTCFQPIAFLS